MITVLTKNYDIDDLAFLAQVINKGIKSLTSCNIHNCDRTRCQGCSMVVVCDDLSRVVRFCDKQVEKETELDSTIIVTTEPIETPIEFTQNGAFINIKRGENK